MMCCCRTLILYCIQTVYGGVYRRLIDNTVIRHSRHRLVMIHRRSGAGLRCCGRDCCGCCHGGGGRDRWQRQRAIAGHQWVGVAALLVLYSFYYFDYTTYVLLFDTISDFVFQIYKLCIMKVVCLTHKSMFSINVSVVLLLGCCF